MTKEKNTGVALNILNYLWIRTLQVLNSEILSPSLSGRIQRAAAAGSGGSSGASARTRPVQTSVDGGSRSGTQRSRRAESLARKAGTTQPSHAARSMGHESQSACPPVQ